MLAKTDILLLDEPTNHLDVDNVAWVKNYLLSLENNFNNSFSRLKIYG